MLGFQITDSVWLTEPVTASMKLRELDFDDKLSLPVRIRRSNQNEFQKPNQTKI